MIIKKKYTITETQKIEPQAIEEVLPAKKNIPSPDIAKEKTEEKKEQVKTEKKDNKQSENKESAAKPKEEKKKNDNLDFSLDNIKFEQRAERREGSRRRGYRRTQDRNIISRAQEDAKSIKEQAKQDGYKEGVENAKKRA